QAFQPDLDEGHALAEHQLLALACHGYFLLFGDFSSGRFATKPESSPWWKKIMPCSSSPARTGQARPCAGSISAFACLVHDTAGGASRVVSRQSSQPWT